MDGPAQLNKLGVAIRCDGSETIGMGHVVRMMALAGALDRAGVATRFVVRSGQQVALDLLRAGGHDVCVIDGHFSRGEVLSGSDADALCDLARGAPVIVDHYGASRAYFARLQELQVRYGVIDDLADRDLTGAQWVLNPIPRFNAVYASCGISHLLLGPQYALLRPEFARARAPRRFTNPATRLLLTLGGGGGSRAVQMLQRALSTIGDLEISCALGRRSASEMAELMAAADIAVSAAGQTSLELACTGLPAVLTRMAENQRENAAALERCGCAIDIGNWDDSASQAVVLEVVRALVADAGARDRMSRAGMDFVDGLGAERAAGAIITLWGSA